MKPDLHNNTNIKQVFEDREISPSANSWNKLANLLDEQLPVPEQQISIVNKSKTNYKYLLGIAAVLLCVFGFSFWTLNDIDNSQFVNESEIGIVNNEISTPKKVLENEYTNDYQLTNTVKSNQRHKTKNTNLEKAKLAAVVPDFDEAKPKTELKKTDTILPTILVKSNDKIQIAWETKTSKDINVNPNNLLRNVERELINERIETELNKPRDRFEQIRMALSNRNYEE